MLIIAPANIAVPNAVFAWFIAFNCSDVSSSLPPCIGPSRVRLALPYIHRYTDKYDTSVYISIGAKAPDIPLYDDGQYRVAAQYRYALYIQSHIVPHWLEHIQLSYFTSNKLESRANETR
jgi:hypothetical protein